MEAVAGQKLSLAGYGGAGLGLTCSQGVDCESIKKSNVNKRQQFLWGIFTVLSLVSVMGAGWALLVYSLTPTLVHDTMHVVGQQLTDAQQEALYPALMKAYRPIIFGGAVVLIAWIALAGIALRQKTSN